MKKILSTKDKLITCIAIIAIVTLTLVVFFLSNDKDANTEEILSAATPTPTVKVSVPPITDNKDKTTPIPTEEPIVTTPSITETPDDNDNSDVIDNGDSISTEVKVEESEVVEEIKDKTQTEKPKDDVVVEENKDVPAQDKETEPETSIPAVDIGEEISTTPEPKEDDKPTYGQDNNTDPGENPFGKGGTIIDDTPVEDYIDPKEGRPGEGVHF